MVKQEQVSIQQLSYWLEQHGFLAGDIGKHVAIFQFNPIYLTVIFDERSDEPGKEESKPSSQSERMKQFWADKKKSEGVT